MEKKYIFLPILVFFVLNNSSMFSSDTNRESTNRIATFDNAQAEDNVIINLIELDDLYVQYENSRNNSYIDHQVNLLKRIRSNNDNSMPAQPIIGFSHSSPAAQSSNQIIPTNSNNTNNQPSRTEQAAYQNMVNNLFPEIEQFFIVQAKIDAEKYKNNILHGNNDRGGLNFHYHLAKFGLTSASSDKSSVDLGPIQKSVRMFTNFNGHAFPHMEALIRNRLKRMDLQRLYNNTFNNSLSSLTNQQTQQQNYQPRTH